MNKSLTRPKRTEKDPLGFFNIHSVEKTGSWDALVSSGIVCYTANLFGSVPWVNGGILKFCKTFGRLFWPLQVYRKKNGKKLKNTDEKP